MSEKERTPDIGEIEERIARLEGLADSLGRVPDNELVGVLDRAVGLLGEINTGIEASLRSAGDEEREIGEILQNVDFGPFDRALEELERREQRGERTDNSGT